MMATVSELSMYQATAMKLQQEKANKVTEIEAMRWKVGSKSPPFDINESIRCGCTVHDVSEPT